MLRTLTPEVADIGGDGVIFRAIGAEGKQEELDHDAQVLRETY